MLWLSLLDSFRIYVGSSGLKAGFGIVIPVVPGILSTPLSTAHIISLMTISRLARVLSSAATTTSSRVPPKSKKVSKSGIRVELGSSNSEFGICP